MHDPNEIRAALAEKADADDQFRARLMSDPRAVIEEEFDLAIPDGVEIQVHQDSSEIAHVILPPSPKLSAEQLSQVAGGKEDGLYYCL